jgi:hypothetical protein
MQEETNNDMDFYFNEDGLMVMTERFLLKRGYCCGNGCRHCPYDYVNVPEPRRTECLNKRMHETKSK